jgi:spermidine/putrescine transport system substrate-binding protein
VVKPNETFVALDLVVFNKKLNENLDKKQKAYNAVKSIALDGLQTDAIISDTTEDDNYKYGIMQNLDYVLYYSP